MSYVHELWLVSGKSFLIEIIKVIWYISNGIENLKCDYQRLVEDLVQIITVFSCKLQGKRANKARKLVKKLIEEGGEGDDENNKSNVTPK